jgi:hypothetical protein
VLSGIIVGDEVREDVSNEWGTEKMRWGDRGKAELGSVGGLGGERDGPGPSTKGELEVEGGK